MPKPRSLGGIATMTAVLAVVSAVALVTVSATVSHRHQPVTPSGREAAQLLVSLGLDPEALAAVGISDNQLTQIFANARDQLAAHPTSIDDARRELSAANAALAGLEDRVRAGQASSQEIASMANIRARAASAATTFAAANDAAFAAISGHLSPEQISLLQTIRGNRSWTLPTEYLVADRQQPQWIALREALDNQRITTARNRPLDVADQATLDSANSSPVISARANLHSRLPDLQSGWTANVAP